MLRRLLSLRLRPASTTFLSAVCASTPRSPSGYALHCLTTVRGDSSQYVFWEAVDIWHGNKGFRFLTASPDSITPHLTFVKWGVCNQNHKRGTTHCCIAVSILPSSRGCARSACRRTCYVVRLRPVALHVCWHEIGHSVAAACSAWYHMVCGERQRVRCVAAPIEWCAAIVAWRSSPFGALAEDGAVAVVESGVLSHYAITSLT